MAILCCVTDCRSPLKDNGDCPKCDQQFAVSIVSPTGMHSTPIVNAFSLAPEITEFIRDGYRVVDVKPLD